MSKHASINLFVYYTKRRKLKDIYTLAFAMTFLGLPRITDG